MTAKIEFVISGLIAVCLTGCSVSQVRVWTNSDSDNPKLYTVQSPHYAHIGQKVDFRVTVSPDVADYVVLNFDGREELLTKVGPGEYGFSWTIDLSCRGRTYMIEARAYRSAGRPDYYREGDQVINRVRDDLPDELVGRGVSRLDCYQSRVTVELKTSNGQEPDWSGGQLEIFGPNGEVRKVGLGRPGYYGFTALGRDARGWYTIFYEPLYDQICWMSRTRIVFSVPDPGTGNPIVCEQWISTP